MVNHPKIKFVLSFLTFLFLDQTQINGGNNHSDSSKSSVVEASQSGSSSGSGSFKLTNNGTNEVIKPSTYPPQKEEGNTFYIHAKYYYLLIC